MFQCIRGVTSSLIARDTKYTKKYPFLYPLLKMTLLFIAIQVFVQIMYQVSGLGSDSIELEEFEGHPANSHTSLFPVDHAPLHVLDDGDYTSLRKLVKSADITMVMSYAPWCHHSIKLAKSFLSLAKNQSEVAFIAINCWDPSGGCRRTEGTSLFPRITLHRKHILGKVNYFGYKNYQAMLYYSQRAVRPLTYLTSVHQFNQLLGLHEILVVGYFNFTNNPMPYGYKNYYLASLLALQTNFVTHSFPNKYMTVVTNSSLASDLFLSNTSYVYLIALHRGVIQNISASVAPETIYNWVSINCTKHKLVNEFIPSGNISYLLTTPISFLFLPIPNMEQSVLSSILSQYTTSSFINQKSTYPCHALNHLDNYCPSSAHSRHTSLPLCSSNSKLLCPKYSPFSYLTRNNRVNLFCQDEVGVVTGGWPPPCSHVHTSFYYVDSTKYWSLAQSMGVTEPVAKDGGPFLIFIDIKNEFQFFFSITNSSMPQFNQMFERIILGTADPLIRSGCGQNNNCSTGEITAKQFLTFLAASKKVSSVLVVHYVSWCVVCTQLWPVLLSVSASYGNTGILDILRINGDYNDIPKCHAPRYYPSLALYSHGSSIPEWFPENQDINYENIVRFIQPHLQHDINMDEENEKMEDFKMDREKSEMGGDQWGGMGWELWEISERERRLLEEKNVRLGGQIGLLREKIAQLEQQQTTKTKKLTLENINLDSIMEEVSRLMGTTTGSSPGSTGASPGSTDESHGSTGASPGSTGASPGSTGASPGSTGASPGSTGLSHERKGIIRDDNRHEARTTGDHIPSQHCQQSNNNDCHL